MAFAMVFRHVTINSLNYIVLLKFYVFRMCLYFFTRYRFSFRPFVPIVLLLCGKIMEVAGRIDLLNQISNILS